MADPYEDFPHLSFDRPVDGVLRLTLDGPDLNAVDQHVHRELADVWPAIDHDPDTNVVAHPRRRPGLLRGRELRADPEHRRGPPGPHPRPPRSP